MRLFLYICGVFTGLFLLLSGGEYALRSLPEEVFPSPAAPAARDHILPPAQEGDRLNLNSASLNELTTLPGIGPATARAILAYREQNGGFHYPEELMDVSGIGSKRFEALRDLVACGPVQTALP